MSINQAVVFTKPTAHLDMGLDPTRLDELAQAFFASKGFEIVLNRKVTGAELAARQVIRQHYLIYSAAVYADPLCVSEDAKLRFAEFFGHEWDAACSAGKIIPLKRLLAEKGISVHDLFGYWNELFADRKTLKLQDGVIMAFVPELDVYCVNAFYPSMEENFQADTTRMSYFVVEFDSDATAWETFRKSVLGSTNASNASPESFRGQLYGDYPVSFPGRDNFAHGSAGPFEGFVERAIHESDFEMTSNPVGRFLADRGWTLDSFSKWKAKCSISRLGDLFDATEEKNTAEVLAYLETYNWE